MFFVKLLGIINQAREQMGIIMRTKDKIKSLLIGAATVILTSCTASKGKKVLQTNTDRSVDTKEQVTPHKFSLDADNKTAVFKDDSKDSKTAVFKEDSNINIDSVSATAKIQELRDKIKQDSLDKVKEQVHQQEFLSLRIFGIKLLSKAGFL